ncbi:MAG: hypothetical protein HY867_14350 [Chloroflexi bacterium]|nr:hypothetical protein [Chloroflexota bacterium]
MELKGMEQLERRAPDLNTPNGNRRVELYVLRWFALVSGETETNQALQSTFEKTPPIPRSYSGQTFFEFIEEPGIAI